MKIFFEGFPLRSVGSKGLFVSNISYHLWWRFPWVVPFLFPLLCCISLSPAHWHRKLCSKRSGSDYIMRWISTLFPRDWGRPGAKSELVYTLQYSLLMLPMQGKPTGKQIVLVMLNFITNSVALSLLSSHQVCFASSLNLSGHKSCTSFIFREDSTNLTMVISHSRKTKPKTY